MPDPRGDELIPELWSVWLSGLEVAKGDYVGFTPAFYSVCRGFIGEATKAP